MFVDGTVAAVCVLCRNLEMRFGLTWQRIRALDKVSDRFWGEGQMHIVTKCQCGKQFKAPEKLAGKHLKCPECGSALVVPTLEQDAMLAAYAEVREQKKESRAIWIVALVGLACLLLLLSLIFRPNLFSCLYVMASASAVAGTIGNIWLIVHAYRHDDSTSGLVMALSFVIPLLFPYTIYYLFKRWDGSAPFLITAGALCGFGAVLFISGAIVTGIVLGAGARQQARQQFLDLARFGLAVHEVYNDGQRPSNELVQKKGEAVGTMTAEQYQKFCREYEICWDALPARRGGRSGIGATVIAYHRASFRDKNDEVASCFLDGSVHRVPYDELVKLLGK